MDFETERIQFNTEIVNAVDIGVVNDGKTDGYPIVSKFLASKENSNKTLYIPKGEYYFSDTIIADGNFAGICVEKECIIHSDGNPCFNFIAELSEKDIKKVLITFYDSENEDYNIEDNELKGRIKRILDKMHYKDKKSIDRLIASILNEHFLSEKMIDDGYGVKDTKSFLDWFETFCEDIFN